MNRMKMKTEILPAEGEAIAKAADLLRRGELVALPTETVYGIAADARNGAAVAKIFVAKGRPQDNPLIVHVTGPEMLPGLVSEVPERAQLLMAAFCPGPLTIIMPRGPEVAAECCAGLDTVGIRMPSHPVARAVIAQSGCAFAAPSANLSGKPSPTNAQDVFTDMDGRLPLILDGGECDVGVESTVISVVGEKPTLFRPGHITLEDLERALGEYLSDPKPNVWFEHGDENGMFESVVLDRRTRMMYDAKHIFINGESYLAGGRDATLMRKLADTRMLSRKDLASASDDALELLSSWFDAGWVRSGD